jgi:hypothetical protein
MTLCILSGRVTLHELVACRYRGVTLALPYKDVDKRCLGVLSDQQAYGVLIDEAHDLLVVLAHFMLQICA